MLEAKELGHRLRTARKSSGFSRRAVADAMDLRRTMVTAWESGSYPVSALELLQLSKLFHCNVEDILRRSADSSIQHLLATVLQEAPVFKYDSALEQIKHHLMQYQREAKLRNIIGIKWPPWYQAHEPDTFYEALAQGEFVAEHERRRLGIGDEPITNISGLIAAQGIWEAPVQLPDQVRGLFLNDTNIGSAVLVNSIHSERRMRFSYALGYAHALLDRRSEVVVSLKKYSSIIEVRANAFASAFLIPKMGAIDGLSIKSPSSIAHEFNVTEPAAKYRISNLRDLDKQENRKFFDHDNLIQL